MDCTNIIRQGEEAKYAVMIDYEGFSMDSDDFKVELSWGLQGQSLTIEKSQMISSIESGYFFIFDTTPMTGRVVAKCTYYVPDIDCPDQIRTVTDEQLLCFVATTPLPRFACTVGVRAPRHLRTLRAERRCQRLSIPYHFSG